MQVTLHGSTMWLLIEYDRKYPLHPALPPLEFRHKVRFHPISFVKGKASPVPGPLTKGFGIIFLQRNSRRITE